jgi:DNA modification methylase
MEIITKRLKLSQIKPNPNNPRRIGKTEMERLIKSLQDFPEMLELREIIVDENNIILGGNMRYRALKQIGEKECIAKIVTGLTLDQKREFIIKDNSNFGSYDMDALANLWSDLPLVEWGVSLPEDWLAGDKAEAKEDDFDADAAAESIVNPITKPGDVWILGKHRVMCGDSTKKEDVGQLCGTQKPLLMVTDPPYGVEYDPNWRNEADRANGKPYGARAVGKVQNDDRSDWSQAWGLFPGDVAYVWHAGRHASSVQASLEISGFEVRSQIIWAKTRLIISRGHYHWQHEPCWYAFRKGKTAGWIGDRSQVTLWTIDHPKSETGHGTQKPIECMARPIRNHEGDVYDPFLGSGTTLIACEQLGRICYGMEIDPVYCDVIVKRWETLTGQKAVLDERP